MRLRYQSEEFIDWEPLIQVTYECTLACQTFEVPYGVTVYETFKLHSENCRFLVISRGYEAVQALIL